MQLQVFDRLFVGVRKLWAANLPRSRRLMLAPRFFSNKRVGNWKQNLQILDPNGGPWHHDNDEAIFLQTSFKRKNRHFQHQPGSKYFQILPQKASLHVATLQLSRNAPLDQSARKQIELKTMDNKKTQHKSDMIDRVLGRIYRFMILLTTMLLALTKKSEVSDLVRNLIISGYCHGNRRTAACVTSVLVSNKRPQSFIRVSLGHQDRTRCKHVQTKTSYWFSSWFWKNTSFA